MQEIKIYKTKDLVLEVSKSYDPAKLDLSRWERFLDILCGDRQYQKEAIENVIIYLASGRYNSIEDLVKENWTKNLELRDRYKNITDYFHHLQLPNRLSATIDLATGTGKSYVIYGIAQIMLGLGLVDRVLVLCPSLTIEWGLKEKFLSLSGDSRLKQTIPENAKYKNPRIIDANITIKDGDICVENIHAVYETTGSSIRDSLLNSGEKVLVLSDEVHHVYNRVSGRDKESQSIKKWKEFLLNPDYNFKYLLGFTGTAYVNDEYFNDCIYRYSLREAVDDKMVKMVDYVSKDESITQDEKFQKIYDNHVENKNKYRKLKPLTILITKDITNAKRLRENLLEFLVKKESQPKEEIEKRVLIVTSAQEHKANIAKLKDVDSKDDLTEWIISVSMLTEGWDVKNVYQIVPWEDRAFNSKLLIAQVLGRGLRIPPEYQSPQPRVRVFNHDAWSRNIKGLVDEILEIEMKLTSSILKNLLRKKGKTVVNIRKANKPEILSTLDMDKENIAVGNLRERSAVFYSSNFNEELDSDKLNIFSDLININEESLGQKYNLIEVNEFLFKTPLDLVFVSHDPEFKFLKQLIKKENAEKIDAWVKSRDQGFYNVEYSFTTVGGKHSKQLSFNPDFFIKIIQNGFEYIVVVEIKADGDDSDENKAKLRWARQHFVNLNKELEYVRINQRYIFHFLSPNSYSEFFEYLKDGRLIKGVFRSDLEDKLEANDRGINNNVPVS